MLLVLLLFILHTFNCVIFVEETITLGLTCPPGIRILLLLEDSAFKYTPSYDEVKKISSLSQLRKHSLNIKCQLKLHM